MKRIIAVLSAFILLITALPLGASSLAVPLVPIEFVGQVFEFSSADDEALAELGIISSYYGKNSAPVLIESAETVAAMSNCFEYSAKTDFDTLFAKYDAEFFEENALILVYAFAPTLCYKYRTARVTKHLVDQTVSLEYEYFAPYGAAPDAMQYNFIFAEVSKSVIPDGWSIEHSCTEVPNIAGDIDGNGTVDASDYLLAKRTSFGTYTLEYWEAERADVYSDNVIDSRDYLLIKRICFGTYSAR